jgi:eukaryotic-like serine/threonine-protein kinase
MPEAGAISTEEIQAELKRVLAADAFKRSPKLSRFLEFIVEESLSHPGGDLKEYRIGAEVFDRGANFDPRSDNIVRSQAYRLRTVLAQHYAETGDSEVVIELLPGSYVPVFRRRPEPAPPSLPRGRTVWSRLRLPAVALAGVLGGFLFRHLVPAPLRPPEPAFDLSIHLPADVMPALDRGIGALSPDGRTLVLPARGGDGLAYLWLRPLNSTSLQKLPNTEDASFPFWSPDGRQIGFFAEGRLKKIRLQGEVVQVLASAPAGRGGSWSERGEIVFAVNFGSSVLLAVSADGGQVRKATQLQDDLGHLWPHFLPGGVRFLYFVRSRKAGRSGFYVGSLDNSPARFVMRQDVMGDAVFAPLLGGRSGLLLFFHSGLLQARPFHPVRLEFVGDLRTVASGIPLPPSSGGNAFTAAGGSVLIYQGGQAVKTRPIWVSRTGREEETSTDAGDFGEVRLSRDGRRVAFERRDAVTGDSDVWMLDLRRGGVTRLTSGPRSRLNPVWVRRSPHLFSGIPVRLTPLDGAPEHPALPTGGRGQWPQDCSADGKKLLIVEENPQTLMDLWLLEFSRLSPLTVHRRIPISTLEGNERQARLSPAGDMVAFASDHFGSSQVYLKLLGAQQASQKVWQVSPGGGSFPLWSPTGGLYYLDPAGTVMEVRVRGKGDEIELSSSGKALPVAILLLLGDALPLRHRA